MAYPLFFYSIASSMFSVASQRLSMAASKRSAAFSIASPRSDCCRLSGSYRKATVGEFNDAFYKNSEAKSETNVVGFDISQE